MVLPRPLALLIGLLASVLVALSGLPATASPVPVPVPVPEEAPALALTGATPDGWEVHRLADGRLPSRLPAGTGFRGEVRFVHEGRARAVRLLVPSSARRPAPLLVALHGLFQTTTATESVMQWGPLVRRTGTVLAYGVGTSASWNAGTCCGAAVVEGVDDVGYLDAVRRLVEALVPLDPRRQYLAGFSNGAMMAYRYACERPGAVAGILAVAGTVTADCRGRTDVAVLHVHGLGDRTVPLAGVPYSPALRTPLRPVARTATMFGPTITARVLPGYGHGWPTAEHGGFATTAAGWSFLAAHPRRTAPGPAR